jgi:hypothetical protein
MIFSMIVMDIAVVFRISSSSREFNRLRDKSGAPFIALRVSGMFMFGFWTISAMCRYRRFLRALLARVVGTCKINGHELPADALRRGRCAPLLLSGFD